MDMHEHYKQLIYLVAATAVLLLILGIPSLLLLF